MVQDGEDDLVEEALLVQVLALQDFLTALVAVIQAVAYFHLALFIQVLEGVQVGRVAIGDALGHK